MRSSKQSIGTDPSFQTRIPSEVDLDIVKDKSMFASSSNSSSLLPGVFQDEPACASMCPQLTYTQRYRLLCLLNYKLSNKFIPLSKFIKNNGICRLCSARLGAVFGWDPCSGRRIF